ncbi:239_t:CDS:1, partial [Dentiscutata heterogama]
MQRVVGQIGLYSKTVIIYKSLSYYKKSHSKPFKFLEIESYKIIASEIYRVFHTQLGDFERMIVEFSRNLEIELNRMMINPANYEIPAFQLDDLEKLLMNLNK